MEGNKNQLDTVYKPVQMSGYCLAGMFLEDIEWDHFLLEGNKIQLDMVLQHNSKQQLSLAYQFCYSNVHIQVINKINAKEGSSLKILLGENKTYNPKKVYLDDSELKLLTFEIHYLVARRNKQLVPEN